MTVNKVTLDPRAVETAATKLRKLRLEDVGGRKERAAETVASVFDRGWNGAGSQEALEYILRYAIKYYLAALPASEPTGWIVANGDGTKWGCWKNGLPDWTYNRDEATRYARREDAEAVHSEDEDAWSIKPYSIVAPAVERDAVLEASLAAITAERDALAAKINSPELHDFAAGVMLEATHQRERWGVDHDGDKTDADWFWLIGYLAGKALHNPANDMPPQDAKLHRIITIAAAAANWHAATLGLTNMRPGIEQPLSTASQEGK
jgi:hypothetical protein